MAKSQNDTMLDQALQWVEDQTDTMCICSGQPATFDAAIGNTGTQNLAQAAIVSTAFTIADGDASGRKTTIAQQTGVSVTTTGTADHIAFVNAASSTLVYITTASSQAVTAGNSMTTAAWDIEIADAT